MTTKSKWRTISLPSDLLDEVEGHVQDAPEYTSMADFVRKAIGEKLRLERGFPELREQPKGLTDSQRCQLETWAEPLGKQLEAISAEDLTELLTDHFTHGWTAEEIALGVVYLMEWLHSLEKN